MCTVETVNSELSPTASKILEGDYWILSENIIYRSSPPDYSFTAVIPRGYVYEKPLVPFLFFRGVISEKSLLLLTFLYETQSILHKGKPFAIENRHCEILFLDHFLKGEGSGVVALTLRYFLPWIRGLAKRDPVYLLRKNAVEFYLTEQAKIDGYFK